MKKRVPPVRESEPLSRLEGVQRDDESDRRTPSPPGRRVLVVDDDPAILRLVSRHLQAAEYEVLTATSGREALRVMLAERPSIVVSDWFMPEMNGLELCRALHENPGVGFVYSIILTGDAEKKRLVEALNAGANDFLAKPFDRDELVARVNAGMRIVRLEADLARKTRELRHANAELQAANIQIRRILESMTSAVISVDLGGCVSEWNQAAEDLLGIGAVTARGNRFDELEVTWDHTAISRAIAECGSTAGPVRLDDVWFKRRDGTEGLLGITATPVKPSADDADTAFLLIAADITERRHLQSQLLQAQRLESVGRLAAGIAHEINTPTQFVSDNTRFLRSAFPKLAELLTRYQQLAEACRSGPVAAELLDGLDAAVKTAKLDYLLGQIPAALSDSLEGLERVTKIVRAMKDFAHPGGQSLCAANLNQAIESTITVARNEWKYVAEMKLDLDPALPQVPCLLGDINQVILNIVVNAAHAIKDALGDGRQGKGTITVATRHVGDRVEVRISDTGTGIPEEHRGRIFEHFFTTKEVDKGTGQGLAIARRVIVEKHHGTLTFETEMGRGTTFSIGLPLQRDATTQAEQPKNEVTCSVGR